jgi:hypothetical protein
MFMLFLPPSLPPDILPGWGITIDPTSLSSFKATKPCPADTYGVAAETFGLQSAPCKACTKNLKSPPGSTSYAACKNRAGFGYTSEGANQVRFGLVVYCCIDCTAAVCHWLWYAARIMTI